jgi:hypothetical protein
MANKFQDCMRQESQMNRLNYMRCREFSFASPSSFSVPSIPRAARLIVGGTLAFCFILQAQQDDRQQAAVHASGTISRETTAFPGGELLDFHPATNVLLSPISEITRQPGFTSSGIGPNSNLLFDVRNVHIPKGVTLSIEGYETVVFRASGDITIDGDIQFPGGKLFILGRDRPAVIRGGIDVSGQNGGNGSNGAAQGNPAGGNGGAGGAGGSVSGGGSGGAAGLGGGGAGGSSIGAFGADGGSTSSPGKPVFGGNYLDCDAGAGGSAGGSNGTAGATAPGRNTGYQYIAQPAFGSPVVGLSPPAAGGGSGGGGGCSVYIVYNNQQVHTAGAGGGGAGGGAGGSVVIQMGTQSLEIDSRSIKANGGNGGNGGNAGPPLVQVSGQTDGSDGGGGGAGGAGGFIVLQGSSITLNNGISSLSAAGGSGGAGGFGSVGTFWVGRGGWYGAGGGGGRIALYSSWPVQNVNASAGSPASTNVGGTPTVLPVTVSMTPTHLDFVPRNSASDPSCSAFRGCTEQYTVTISPSNVTGVATFQLSSSALTGFATNYCSQSNCTDPTYDTGPDYVFEGYRNYGFNTPVNQTIQTSSAVNSATVTVSSYDYGGSAKLSAFVNINGIPVTAGVTQPTQGSTLQEPFARLPVDVCGPAGCRPTGDTNPVENCMTDPYSNCIADYWEQQVSPTRYLDRNEDNEEGSPGSASHGDGYSAHDEYRGFVIWDGAQVVHVRTNPVAVKDVFYWDQAGVGDAVRAIFQPAASPGMSLYQILDQSANLLPPTPSSPYPVAKHNRNSATPNGPSGFAVVYMSGGPADCALAGNELGVTYTKRNDGSDAILIENDAITCTANRFTYASATLLGQVVAHETGHKFGIEHPRRTPGNPAYIDLATLGDVGALGPNQFTFDTTAQLIYVWLSSYSHSDTMSATGTSTVNSEHVARPLGLTVANGSPGDLGIPSEVPGTRTGNTAIYSIHYTNPLGTMAGGGYANLIVEIQEMLIMDWAPNFNVMAWAFNPRDILAMCVKQTCP